MAVLLYTLGRRAVRHRRVVILAWVVILVGLGVATTTLTAKPRAGFELPGSESQRALDSLADDLPAAGGASGNVLFRAPAGQTVRSPQVRSDIDDIVAGLSELPEVTAVTSLDDGAVLSQDGRFARISVQFAAAGAELSDATYFGFSDLATSDKDDELTIAVSGDVFGNELDVGSGETIGLAVAVIVLVLTLGSLLAAGMTLATALVGVLVGILGIGVVSAFVEMSSVAPILALMLGLAVGIDYALFIFARHREQRCIGMPADESVARALATAGSAVFFAGLTVVIALTGLSLVGIPFLTAMGIAAAGAVMVAVLVALTLVPAVLGMLGDRVVPKGLRGSIPRTTSASATWQDPADPAPQTAHSVRTDDSWGRRWARFVTRRPVVCAVTTVVVLGLMSLPLLSMRLALPDGGRSEEGSRTRTAYDLTAQAFGEGANAQLVVVVRASDAAMTAALTSDMEVAVTRLPNVVAVDTLGSSETGTTTLLSVTPADGPQDESTAELVKALRAEAASVADRRHGDVSVTGQTALDIDVSKKLSDVLPVYLAVVLGLSLVLLVLVFRSVVVPLKAALGFLLSIGSSLGATVAVFQWGWLLRLIGVDTTGPLISFMPVVMVGVLFGLAMDYQVFIVSRIREEVLRGLRPDLAIVEGLGHGSRTVAAAAVIMIAVFAGFTLAPSIIVAMMGFGLALGVLIDAFVVRMTLIPALLAILGDRAWRLPSWLDRLLPEVQLEGPAAEQVDGSDRRCEAAVTRRPSPAGDGTRPDSSAD
jgi:RND superfamily putative drug exporter